MLYGVYRSSEVRVCFHAEGGETNPYFTSLKSAIAACQFFELAQSRER